MDDVMDKNRLLSNLDVSLSHVCELHVFTSNPIRSVIADET